MNSRLPAVFVFLTLVVFSPLSARKHEFHLYAEPEFFFLNGKQEEFVFYDETKNSDGLVSQLEWNEEKIKLYGAKTGFSIDRFGADFQLFSAIKGKCGEMYDSDWLNYDDVKTHYSKNQNNLESYFQLSLLAYFDFHPFRNFEGFSIAPTIEGGYRNILFSSENIEGWYGNMDSKGIYSAWDSKDATHYPNDRNSLCGIEYEKIVFYFFLGARAKVDLFKDRLHLAVGGGVSPYSYVKSEDKHYEDLQKKKYAYYKDYIDVVFKTFKGNFSTFFDINDIISLGINGEGLISRRSKGTLTKLEGPENTWRTYEGNWGGVSDYSFKIGFGVRINLF